MIKLTRVDERLVHGQVAFAWVNYLGADCIFVINDAVAKDKLRATTLKLAAPTETKFVVKSVDEAISLINGNKTDKYKIFALVDNTADALRLVREAAVGQINLGNLKAKEGTQVLTNSIAVTEGDIDNIKGMLAAGAEVECRAVPTDKKAMAETLLQSYQ